MEETQCIMILGWVLRRSPDGFCVVLVFSKATNSDGRKVIQTEKRLVSITVYCAKRQYIILGLWPCV
jgi:hypothetical protein